VVGLGVLGLVGCLALTGCGGGDRKAVVKGRVTLDGEPVPTGTVQFFPEDKNSPSGKSGTIENGSYAAQDVPVGKVRVVINSTKVIGKRKMYGDSYVEEYGEEIPEKYNSKTTLVKEIKPGENEIDFELTRK
jgi:hypothetical protein